MRQKVTGMQHVALRDKCILLSVLPLNFSLSPAFTGHPFCAFWPQLDESNGSESVTYKTLPNSFPFRLPMGSVFVII
jgi:hypothetical protein